MQRTRSGVRLRRAGTGRLLGILVVVWLVIGAFAAWQRDYFENTPMNCAGAGTVALTVVAGPLNYLGVNPKVTDCALPEPSK
ncbi:hypothetical protein OG921_11660 [Aldersonia sp. NBC_00410]|uniref:hypothetical protein n=1 Tax=Aldersonia sp. NBC_00410 TaxID=2975954 RepID=UPI002255E45B|nr:hypothetical protein [Aldersonia sp. NBC_00410]MCX5043822.1 hypothetical protein [Aldersonia sp. NBC_00410]